MNEINIHRNLKTKLSQTFVKSSSKLSDFISFPGWSVFVFTLADCPEVLSCCALCW